MIVEVPTKLNSTAAGEDEAQTRGIRRVEPLASVQALDDFARDQETTTTKMHHDLGQNSASQQPTKRRCSMCHFAKETKDGTIDQPDAFHKKRAVRRSSTFDLGYILADDNRNNHLLGYHEGVNNHNNNNHLGYGDGAPPAKRPRARRRCSVTKFSLEAAATVVRRSSLDC